jgi:hypothetical protein
MKNLFVSFLLLFVSLVSFSQKLIVELYEKQDFVSYRKTTIDSVLMSPDYIFEIDNSKTKYVFDLDEKTSSFYREDEFISDLPISFEKISENLIMIQILQEGLNYGLLINMDPTNESVSWYGFFDFSTTIMKANRFKIFKPC